MYQALFYDYGEKQYYVRDDQRGFFEQKYFPKYYYLDDQGDIPTLDGFYCREISRFSDWRDPNIYEKDVNKLTRYLVDHYFETDEVPSYQNLVYFDIETEIVGALTAETVKAAPMAITSIALYDQTTNQKYCWIVDKENKIESSVTENKHIIHCVDEEELMNLFLDKWEECNPTIIVGWNSCFFDVPVLYYRITKILGKSQALRLSPIKKVKYNENNEDNPIELGCINHLDYMLLFKKYVTKQEDSYKLNDIGFKYVDLGKIEYEGSLTKLFADDINKFIDYNLRDIEIIIKLEAKLKFIELTINICHLCHVPYEQIYLSTVLNEGAILTYLKRKGIVSPNKPTTINKSIQEINENDTVKVHKSLGGGDGIALRVYDEKVDVQFKSGVIRTYPLKTIRKLEEYAGGYLKDPIPGLYEWIIDLDYTSLYPSIIRSLNIGLETLIGRIVNSGKYDNSWTLDNLEAMDPNLELTIQKLNESRQIQESTITVGKILKFIKDNNIIIAANGSLFRTDINSVVCEVLEDWFNKRKEYNNLKKKYGKEGNKEKEEFYDKRQHAYKIKLNDVYGSYAINGWRYTDGHKFISAAITLTGQKLDQEAIKFSNDWLNKKLGTEGRDYVITADTDSLFIHVRDFLLQKNVDLNDKEAAVKETLEIAHDLQKEVNNHLNQLAKRLFNLQDRKHYFELKQEVILERGYFAGKRRYAQYIINKEGVPKKELDIKGMDLMKSNMPITYRKFGKEILEDILFGRSKVEINKKIVDFKKSLKTRDWHEIAKPTGIKKLAEYIKRPAQSGEIFSELEKGCPINTRASVYYNDLLKFKKLNKKFDGIVEGDRIKYIALKQNPYKIDLIAFTGNDPDFINEFIEEYVDREHVFESVLLNKLTNLYQDIKWEFPSLNERVSRFFKFQ